MKKSNTQQAFWVGLGYLGTFLVALGSAMVLSRYLSKEDYGTYRQIIYLNTMLQGIFSAGLPAAYSYFLPKLSLAQGKKLSEILLLLFLILGSFMSLILYICAPILSNMLNNPSLELNIRLFSSVPFFLIPTLGIEGLFTSVRKTEQLLVYNILTKFFMFFCLTIPVIFFKTGIQGILYGWIISAVFTFLMALYFKNKPFKDVKSVKLPFRIYNIFKYTIPIMLTSYIAVLQQSADQFFISRYFGEVAFADYSNGFFEIPFVGMVTGSVSAVMMPIFSGIGNDRNKLIKAVQSWRNALEKSVYLIYPLLCFCFITSAQLILIVYGNKYDASILYFKYALFLNFFKIVLLGSIIISLGKTKFYLVSNIIFALTIWLTKYITVSIFDTPYAVAFVSVINSIIMIIVPYVYLNRILNIKLISYRLFLRILKIIFIGLLSAFISSFLIDFVIEYNDLLFSLIIKSMLFAVLYFLILYVLHDLSHYSFILKVLK